MEKELFGGVEPRVFTTNPDDPGEGRTFVWAKTRWYERLEGTSGAVAFTPVADSENELRVWLSQQQLAELTELDDEEAYMVREEFLEQSALYPEAPELSDEEPFQEQEPG